MKNASIGNKGKDVVVLILFIILAAIYAFLTKDLFIGKALFVGMAFAVPPMIYMGFRKPKNWKKICVSAVLFGVLFAFPFDSIAEYTKTWTSVSLIFPWKIFGVEPIDNLLWYALMTAYTVTFYEHFIDRDKNHHLSRNLKYAIWPGVFASIALIFILVLKINIHFRYPYLIMGLAAITPPILLGLKHPPLIKKMLYTALYFFPVYFIYELFAANYSYWVYRGNNYIGWVTFLNVTFPFEELFFWMIFFAASLVSYYEIFIDDQA
jgi:hypothetical protein